MTFFEQLNLSDGGGTAPRNRRLFHLSPLVVCLRVDSSWIQQEFLDVIEFSHIPMCVHLQLP